MNVKLSASAITAFLKSPKSFYFQYLHNGTGVSPIQPSVQDFSHDLCFGSRWAEFVHAFYQNAPAEDFEAIRGALHADLLGWVPDKILTTYLDAFSALMANYYASFRTDDGCRTPETSELRVESDRFVGRLDGISADGIIHECKATRRAPSLDTQLWKVENSIQVKLYAVLTGAEGVRIEFAYKDSPCVVYRAPMKKITATMRQAWSRGLDCIADSVEACISMIPEFGPEAFPCHPDGCTIVTQRFVGSCPWRLLCDADPAADHFFEPRKLHIDERTGKELHIVIAK